MFKADYKSAVIHMNKCYDTMSKELALTVLEVKARRVKYWDGFTKAVKQYAEDLEKGTCELPTAAATKLSVFNWLLPFCCHYNTSVMDGQHLDHYIEKILCGHANRLDRNKLDSSKVRQTLSSVSTYLRDVGKPRRLVLSVPKLDFYFLQCVAMEYSVTFLHSYLPMTVFKDDSAACVPWETFSVSDIPSTVSSWPSCNIDPTFDWAKAGMKHFCEHVVITLPPLPGKLAVVKRPDAMAVALNRAANASKQARLAIDKAHTKQCGYSDSIVYGFGLAAYGNMITVNDALQCAHQQGVMLCLFLTDIASVVQSILHLEKMRARVSELPAHVVRYDVSLLHSLKAAQAHSKLFSSQFWNLPKRK